MISVVIPLYNKEKIIERSLQSVLSQNYDDFEVVVVNDGSTDRSVEIVKSISDPRITLIEQENGGPSKARNTGVKNAKGEWILFLDADDELLPGALRHLFSLAKKNKRANIIDGSYIVSTKEGSHSYISADVLVKNNYRAFFYREILPSTGHTLFKKTLLEKYPYNQEIRRYEDVELILRLLREANIITTSEPIFCVNSEFSSASSARRRIEEDFLGHLDFRGKSFWEYMSLYQFYLWERDNYPQEVRNLYPNLHLRYDLLILYKLLLLLKRIHVF